jgi:hypothetical protein
VRAREILPAAAPREDEVYNTSIRGCSASGNGTPQSTHESREDAPPVTAQGVFFLQNYEDIDMSCRRVVRTLD